MQTRNKSVAVAPKPVSVATKSDKVMSMSYNSFLTEANRLINSAKRADISRQDQLLYIIELFTLIERNIVKVYMTEIMDFPSMHERFLKLINVIYKKADDIYNDIGKMLTELCEERDQENILLCFGTIQTLCRARTELLVITEKRGR